MAEVGERGDAGRWQRVEDVFQAALDLEGEARERLLAETCAGDEALRLEVDSLLRAYESADGVIGGAIRDTARQVVGHGELVEGQQIGAYRILSKLARGGMGAVYLAERADGLYEARVAIKVIRPEYATSESLWQRFRAEQRILATLTHPNIGRMLDAGITEQRSPYVVMEYIDGAPLHRYCRKREMSLRERLELFRTVCGAVAYAHRNLVIHRDIKPPNILVTEDGTPKLLDFGIAKLLEQDGAEAGLTRAGERMMTPEYASPEAIRGEPATTQVDVFALGVVLYELLTGEHPFIRENQTQWDLEQTIVREEARPPSTRGGVLAKARRDERADLDAIVMTAMRKEPAERYASVEALSEDVRRFLAGETVEAARSSRWYAAKKFVRRNKLAVAAGAMVVVMLAGVAVSMSLLAARAERERRLAEQSAAFLRSMFQNADPHMAPGRMLTARDLMDRGSERMQKELAGQPYLQGQLLDTMVAAYKNLGEYERAELAVRAEIAAHQRAYGKDSAQEANALRQLADIMRLRGKPGEAEQALRRALEIQRRTLKPGDAQLGHALNNLGLVVQSQGKAEEAVALFRQAVEITAQSPDPAQEVEALTMRGNMAQALSDAGRREEGVKLAREVLAARKKRLGEDHPQVARSMYRLAVQLDRAGEVEEAMALTRGAVGLARKLVGETHPDVFIYRNLGAKLMLEKGDVEGAEREYQAVIAGAVRRFGAGHAEAVYFRMGLAGLRVKQGRLEEAEKLYREGYELFRRTLGENGPRTRAAKKGLETVAERRGAAPPR
ncbi:MAG: serine/threonine protein kinase [Bryobacterales bacterium]|nr:serine/threonine protein kinase [Bryobacterales bacterium]